jgi:hypothetical protein
VVQQREGLRLHRRGRRPGRVRPLLGHPSDGYRSLDENQRVEFDVVQGPKGPQADGVRIVG